MSLVSTLFSLSCERGSGTSHHLNRDSNLLLLPLSLLSPHLAHPSSVSAPPLISNPVLTVGRQTTAPATMSTAASGTTMGLVEQGRCSDQCPPVGMQLPYLLAAASRASRGAPEAPGAPQSPPRGQGGSSHCPRGLRPHLLKEGQAR